MEITYHPIGTIHTPHTTREGMPIQPTGAKGVRGTIDIFPEYAEGVVDLDGFSHIILLYHLHKSSNYQLTVTPFLDTRPHGVFATRAPKRPNPIGLSIIKLIKVEENTLTIEDVDILDGTPLLDIKPYVPEFDSPEDIRIGWLEPARGEISGKRSDDRFT
jgi:tRNA-Thr(GGU) m(6)t(6)A37 methyltransferase TsaA